MNRLIIHSNKTEENPKIIKMTAEEFAAKARVATPQEVEEIKKRLLKKTK